MNCGTGFSSQVPHCLELLSDREFQEVRMLASGRTVKQIADEIALSVKTVSTYRARILLKTGMKITAELIRYAHQAGLVV